MRAVLADVTFADPTRRCCANADAPPADHGRRVLAPSSSTT